MICFREIEFTLKRFASAAMGTVKNGSTIKEDNSKKTATTKTSDKRNEEIDSKDDTSSYINKSNARGNNDYRPLSGVSDDLGMSHLRGGHMHNSSLAKGQTTKRIKTEILTTGRRHNFEIQPSRYRGSSHTHLGQLPSIDGTGSAAANKTGYISEYA